MPHSLFHKLPRYQISMLVLHQHQHSVMTGELCGNLKGWQRWHRRQTPGTGKSTSHNAWPSLSTPPLSLLSSDSELGSWAWDRLFVGAFRDYKRPWLLATRAKEEEEQEAQEGGAQEGGQDEKYEQERGHARGMQAQKLKRQRRRRLRLLAVGVGADASESDDPEAYRIVADLRRQVHCSYQRAGMHGWRRRRRRRWRVAPSAWPQNRPLVDHPSTRPPADPCEFSSPNPCVSGLSTRPTVRPSVRPCFTQLIRSSPSVHQLRPAPHPTPPHPTAHGTAPHRTALHCTLPCCIAPQGVEVRPPHRGNPSASVPPVPASGGATSTGMRDRPCRPCSPPATLPAVAAAAAADDDDDWPRV
jgi:hypothetical protein